MGRASQRTAKRPPPADTWQRRLAQNPTLIGWVLFMLLSLIGLVRFVATLPTAQDRIVRQFFTHTQRGDYDSATAVIEGGTYTALAGRSQFRGLPEGAVSLGTLLAPEVTIEEELRAAPAYVSPIKFTGLRTQRDKNKQRKLVQFAATFEVYTTPSLPFGPAPDLVIPFTMEGLATVDRVGDNWRLHALDVMMRPDNPRDLVRLIRLFGGNPP